MCSAVDVTPFVVEYDTARVSSRHGVPLLSRTPVQALTTGLPWWYTHTAAPPPLSTTCASRVVTTSSKAVSHVPSAIPALPRATACPRTWIAHLVKEQYRSSSL